MAKAREYVPIYVYIMKTQILYNKFQRDFIATDGEATLSCEYKQYDPESARNFHTDLVSSLEQKEGEVELHCDGKLEKLTDEYSLDGYFGRPRIIVHRESFVRRLNPPERSYLKKQFDKLCKGMPLKLKLVD